ncbi:MAG: outer membrane beta-barrel protein [Chitinophagaceae bacterium]|nr:outer membrane beta-barrel protein [Chitinophagaceae bacterium]
MQVLRYTLIIVLFFGGTVSLYSQKLAYGVNLDLNYSSGSGKGLQDKMKPGYGGGIWINYPATKKLKLQPELWLTQYNYIKADDFDKYYKNNAGRIGARTKIRLANANLPLLLRYDIIPWIIVFAGPQIGIVVFEDENLRKDGVNAFRKTELSAVGGLEFNLGTVGVFGRYTQGVSNINNMDSRYQWKSQHIDLGISLRVR